MHPEIIAEYDQMLEGALQTDDFYRKVIALLLSDPYALVLYPEIAEYLEVKGLKDERRSLLEFACAKGAEILSDPALLQAARTRWTQRDGRALLEIIEETRKAGGAVPGNLFALRARGLYAKLAPEPSRVAKNLVLMRKVEEVALLRDEIARNEISWIVNTSRQDSIAVHKDTNAIVLRSLSEQTREFKPVDGPHESVRTPLAPLFPRTIEMIEHFAADMRGGLGRVALVRLKPHSRVFRHYDGEVGLIGRNRYHLVIRSREGSWMTSGTEHKLFAEGDLFLFNNKVMHTAENHSGDWRIHVIFDMKVPEHIAG